jgi:hypothetical protein
MLGAAVLGCYLDLENTSDIGAEPDLRRAIIAIGITFVTDVVIGELGGLGNTNEGPTLIDAIGDTGDVTATHREDDALVLAALLVNVAVKAGVGLVVEVFANEIDRSGDGSGGGAVALGGDLNKVLAGHIGGEFSGGAVKIAEGTVIDLGVPGQVNELPGDGGVGGSMGLEGGMVVVRPVGGLVADVLKAGGGGVLADVFVGLAGDSDSVHGGGQDVNDGTIHGAGAAVRDVDLYFVLARGIRHEDSLVVIKASDISGGQLGGLGLLLEGPHVHGLSTIGLTMVSTLDNNGLVRGAGSETLVFASGSGEGGGAFDADLNDVLGGGAAVGHRELQFKNTHGVSFELQEGISRDFLVHSVMGEVGARDDLPREC